jgi:hypothetical protein
LLQRLDKKVWRHKHEANIIHVTTAAVDERFPYGRDI